MQIMNVVSTGRVAAMADAPVETDADLTTLFTLEPPEATAINPSDISADGPVAEIPSTDVALPVMTTPVARPPRMPMVAEAVLPQQAAVPVARPVFADVPDVDPAGAWTQTRPSGAPLKVSAMAPSKGRETSGGIVDARPTTPADRPAVDAASVSNAPIGAHLRQAPPAAEMITAVSRPPTSATAPQDSVIFDKDAPRRVTPPPMAEVSVSPADRDTPAPARPDPAGEDRSVTERAPADKGTGGFTPAPSPVSRAMKGWASQVPLTDKPAELPTPHSTGAVEKAGLSVMGSSDMAPKPTPRSESTVIFAPIPPSRPAVAATAEHTAPVPLPDADRAGPVPSDRPVTTPRNASTSQAASTPGALARVNRENQVPPLPDKARAESRAPDSRAPSHTSKSPVVTIYTAATPPVTIAARSDPATPIHDPGAIFANATLDSPVDTPDLAGPASTAIAEAGAREALLGPRTPVARAAIAQVAEMMRSLPEGSVEVRLSPEELGRVKLTLVPGEAGLVVQMMAERAETLDLLRRNADLLAADLRDAGYSGLEFSFGREDRGDTAHSADEQARRASEPPANEISAEAAVMNAKPVLTGLSPTGLDIRL